MRIQFWLNIGLSFRGLVFMRFGIITELLKCNAAAYDGNGNQHLINLNKLNWRNLGQKKIWRIWINCLQCNGYIGSTQRCATLYMYVLFVCSFHSWQTVFHQILQKYKTKDKIFTSHEHWTNLFRITTIVFANHVFGYVLNPFLQVWHALLKSC